MQAIKRLIGAFIVSVALPVLAVDTYNDATNELTIPFVKAYGKTYRDVVIEVGEVLEVNGGFGGTGYDNYDEKTNKLYIPTVSAFGQNYTNVVITVGPIKSVGGEVTKPVAIAPPVYAVGPYVMIDGRQSFDPSGKRLSYNWSVPVAPGAGWNKTWGNFIANDDGTAVFTTYMPDSGYFGNFDVLLSVSNGSESSEILSVPITIC